MKKHLYVFSVFLLIAFGSFAQDIPEKTHSSFYLGFASGINNPVGIIGPTLELNIGENVGIMGGVGLGSWGYKVSAAVKFYPDFPQKWAFSAGFSHASGLDHVDLEIDGNFLETSSATKNVPVRLLGSNTLNLSILHHWMLSSESSNRFHLEFGYAVPLTNTPYEIKSNDRLNNDGKRFMDILRPGGLMLGIGFSFGLD